MIANREPYIHQLKGDKIEVVRPASGLVTALEPILRQCGGLWIAHGSGSADAQVVDAQNEVAVPPAQPKYKLRRVWLTEEEESGYYYGFANEGFWPLCHLAHNRPIFRLPDWEQYKSVNAKFAEAVPDSSLGSDSLILVQDYHFALLPQMLRRRTARAGPRPGQGQPALGLFWHIPWPNAEAFGICPWNEELLRGMLGADVIGFHTQYHCNNFLETCNRYLEARIDYEHFTVTMENQVTEIRAFPIGIDTSPVRFLTDREIEALKKNTASMPSTSPSAWTASITPKDSSSVSRVSAASSKNTPSTSASSRSCRWAPLRARRSRPTGSWPNSWVRRSSGSMTVSATRPRLGRLAWLPAHPLPGNPSRVGRNPILLPDG